MFETSTTLTVFYYVIAMVATFMIHVLLHELVTNVAAILESHTSLNWVRKIIYWSFLAIRGANRWIWPGLIVYGHFGNNVFELVSVSGAIALALYLLWWQMLSDSDGTIREFEVATYHH